MEVKIEVTSIHDDVIWMTRIDVEAIETDMAFCATLSYGIWGAVADVLRSYETWMS